MKPSSVTDLLFNQLSFRSDRQKIISSNISNINTPGYKTKDLVFESELKKVDNDKDLKMFATNSKHITSTMDLPKMNQANLVELKGLQEQNDGNNVNLDTQMSEMSKNKVIFDALQSSIKKDSRLMRSVVESSQKN
ncbi:flagellar basal body rod protein FlgB [Arcobacter sp. LA11]|uniref:flagellar basal body rod protein FlgB n=1 Tax=Arcobacter sp. LA11 TaxID=1898176 RepID=UPI000933E05A|nr:flagellar basal body rod protein FlgB [Arcobacter sp. LA11]